MDWRAPASLPGQRARLALFICALCLVAGYRGEAQTRQNPLPPSEEKMAAPSSEKSAPTTLIGVRITVGNAVDCPQLRTDDGHIHAVKGLAADIALGERVSVTGRYGITPTCLGPVLVIEQTTRF